MYYPTFRDDPNEDIKLKNEAINFADWVVKNLSLLQNYTIEEIYTQYLKNKQ